MAKEQNKYRELGLWITWKILNMTCLSGDDKIYYAYVYSFGERGCWQTDLQIGKALGRSGRTIQRYQFNCRKAGLLRVIGQGSSYRKIWAKDHPKYIAWRKKKAIEIRQKRKSTTTKLSELPRQTCQGSTTNLSESLRQNCPTTNKETIKITIKESGGSPSPADGQAHSPHKNKQEQLEAYKTKEETTVSIEQLKNSFGYGAPRVKLEPEEIERRRQEQQRRLKAVEAAEKK
ncbi:MAG: hypothetical protein JW787_02810 [Sedimentisphaerales bacterium]|nr:hypothetical protein [Sedimentisphaerales bacterium]